MYEYGVMGASLFEWFEGDEMSGQGPFSLEEAYDRVLEEIQDQKTLDRDYLLQSAYLFYTKQLKEMERREDDE